MMFPFVFLFLFLLVLIEFKKAKNDPGNERLWFARVGIGDATVVRSITQYLLNIDQTVGELKIVGEVTAYRVLAYRIAFHRDVFEVELVDRETIGRQSIRV